MFGKIAAAVLDAADRFAVDKVTLEIRSRVLAAKTVDTASTQRKAASATSTSRPASRSSRR